MKGYGKKLRELRGKKSLREVAKDIGVSAVAIMKYEKEEMAPRDDIKIKLSKYYGRGIMEIFFT